MDKNSLRVFAHIYNPQKKESDDCAVVFLSKPLVWKEVVSNLLRGSLQDNEDATYSDEEIKRCRIFLLVSGTSEIAAELTTRSLQFGIRDNDQLVLCRHGEDYCNPAQAMSSKPTNQDMSVCDGSNPGMAPSAHTKRYRSISGKLALINRLRDEVISSTDKMHLKDLIVKGDIAPHIEELLEEYAKAGTEGDLKDRLKEALLKTQKKKKYSWKIDVAENIALNEVAITAHDEASVFLRSPQFTHSQYIPMSVNYSTPAFHVNPYACPPAPSHIPNQTGGYLIGARSMILPTANQHVTHIKNRDQKSILAPRAADGIPGARGFGARYQSLYPADHVQTAGRPLGWTSKYGAVSYPPKASKEVRQEKIKKWLKKRKTRKWSSGPAYPARHEIARSRRRGQNGRFIPRAQRELMEKEELEAETKLVGAEKEVANS